MTMPVMTTYLAVLAAFGFYVAVASLLGRVPIVRPAVGAAAFATAAAVEILVQAFTWSLDVRFVALVAALSVLGAAVTRGKVQVLGVGERAFVAALRRALDDLEWRFELRVDGSERVDRIVLTEAYRGVEFHVRARDAHASVAARGAVARELLIDLVDTMEAQLRGDAAAASAASRARYALLAVAGVAVAVVYFFL